MVQIVMTPEQANVLANANESVEIVDTRGNRLGFFFARQFSEQEIVIARQLAASDEPRHSTAQVLARLQSAAS